MVRRAAADAGRPAVARARPSRLQAALLRRPARPRRGLSPGDGLGLADRAVRRRLAARSIPTTAPAPAGSSRASAPISTRRASARSARSSTPSRRSRPAAASPRPGASPRCSAAGSRRPSRRGDGEPGRPAAPRCGPPGRSTPFAEDNDVVPRQDLAQGTLVRMAVIVAAGEIEDGFVAIDAGGRVGIADPVLAVIRGQPAPAQRVVRPTGQASQQPLGVQVRSLYGVNRITGSRALVSLCRALRS